MAKEIDQSHFVGEVDQKIIIEAEGRILMCRNVGSKIWDLPGGRLHKGETPLLGLRREIYEELGIEVKIGNAIFFYVIPPRGEEAAKYFVVFTGELFTPNEKFVLAPDEVEEINWFSPEEIEELYAFDSWKEAIRQHFSQKKH